MRHLYASTPVDRDEAKVMFFSAFYNNNDMSLNGSVYNRDKVLNESYKNNKIITSFGREIEVDERRAFNYLIQSTTADLTLDRAVELDKALRGTKSHVAFIVHDEIVLDLHDEDKHLVPQLKEIFQNNKLGNFMANVKAGKNYGKLKELKL